MAISGVIRSYDENALANREDLADIISSISPSETPLFTMLNRGPQAISTKHEWLEDGLRGMRDALHHAVSAGTVSGFRVLNGATRIPCTTNYPVMVRIDEEIILARARTTNFISLMTRGYASTASAAHASLAVVEILADIQGEGSDARTAFAQTKTRPFNYTQTFTQTVFVSGTQNAVVMAGGASEKDYQIGQRYKELAIMVERSLISGIRNVNSTSTNFMSMGGLWYYISTNKTNASSAAISENNIMDDAKACWDAGGRPSVLLCNSTQMQHIIQLYATRVRTEPEAIFGGNSVSKILCPWTADGTLSLILDPWVPQHEYYILDMSKLSLVPLRQFFEEPLAKAGDAEKSQIIGEYTLEVMNETAHARRYGLSVS